jgi:formyl-CoA transferase
MEIFGEIEKWTMTKTKFEAMDILNKHDIPCGPILSMKELAEEPSLRKTGPSSRSIIRRAAST